MNVDTQQRLLAAMMEAMASPDFDPSQFKPTDSLSAVDGIKAVLASPERGHVYPKLLFAMHEKRLRQNPDKRAVLFVFASTKRLHEWMRVGDCSVPARAIQMTLSEAQGVFGKMYPGTLKSATDEPDVFFVVLGTDLLGTGTQTFSATGIRPLAEATRAELLGAFPEHAKLSFQER
jgi:hypothetical protein